MTSERGEGTAASGAAKRFGNFLTSVTGVLASLATLITAAVTLYFTVLNPEGGQPTATPTPTPSPSPQPVPPPPEPAPVTLDEWRREANSLCGESNRVLRATFGRPPQGYEELVQYYRGALPVVTRAFIDLRGLDAPPDRAEDIAEFLDSFASQNANAEEAILAWQAGNAPAFQRAVAEVGRASNRASTLAASLGARECALGPFG
jgi:hypothetical protein